MKDREQLQCWIHHAMAMTGGYLGIYAIICRDDFLGNAQTANLIYMVRSLIGQDFADFGLRILAMLIYMSGIAITVVLRDKYHANLHIFSVAVTSAAVLVLAMLPEEMNVVISLYPIFFAMSIQWNSFPGAYGYVSSSIFSTNNVRQVAIALTEYSIKHDRKCLHKAKFFAGTLICFHLGVAFSIVTNMFLGYLSVLLCYVPLLISGSLIAYETVYDRRRIRIASAKLADNVGSAQVAK